MFYRGLILCYFYSTNIFLYNEHFYSTSKLPYRVAPNFPELWILMRVGKSQDFKTILAPPCGDENNNLQQFSYNIPTLKWFYKGDDGI